MRVQADLMKLVQGGHIRDRTPARQDQLHHLLNPWLPSSLFRVLKSPVKGKWRV